MKALVLAALMVAAPEPQYVQMLTLFQDGQPFRAALLPGQGSLAECKAAAENLLPQVYATLTEGQGANISCVPIPVAPTKVAHSKPKLPSEPTKI